jgi:hypothetical protein
MRLRCCAPQAVSKNGRSGTKSPKAGFFQTRQEVCVGKESKKEFFEIDGTKLECL